MPQPIARDSFYRPNRIPLLRPQCGVLIAAILSAWANVEETLEFLFSAALGSRQPMEASGLPPNLRPFGGGEANLVAPSWPAMVTMRELESIRMRLTIVRKTLIVLLPENLAERWKAIERDISARSKERNRVAHTAWWITDDYPEDLVYEDETSRRMRCTPHDFEDTLVRIEKLNSSLDDFMRAVFEWQRSPEGSARMSNVTR